MKRFLKILAITLSFSTLAACKPYADFAEVTPAPMAMETPAPTPEPTPEVIEPQAGGTLRIPVHSTATLNPLTNEDVTLDGVLRLLYEPLMLLDENQKPQPNLLQNVEFSPDGLSVTLRLKSDLKWQDGEPITPEDILYSLDVLKAAPENAIYKATMQNIFGYSLVPIDEEDESAGSLVKIFYNQPFGAAVYQLCFPIIPQHIYGAVEAGQPEPDPVGNGLYAFDGRGGTMVSGAAINLKASANVLGKRPYISKIQTVTLSDDETDLHALEQGLIDAAPTNISDWAGYLDSNAVVASEYVSQYFDFVGFNFNNPIFQEKDNRMAVAHLIDKKTLITDVYEGHAVAVNAPISPASWLYEPGTTNYAYDPEQAKTLFTAEARTASITILTNIENAERVKIADTLCAAMLFAGISCTVESLPFEQYQERLAAHDFDLFVGGFDLSLTPDLTFAFHSAQDVLGINYFSYESDKADAFLTQAFVAVNEESFKSAQSDLQKFLSEDLPCVSLAFRKSAVITTPNVLGDKKPDAFDTYANIEDWFMR